MGLIYIIKNTINDKVYIGQTVQTLTERWWGHKYCSKYSDAPLYRAMRKHGFENFSIEILEQCDNSQLNEREIYYIEFYDSMAPNGYNGDLGGKGRTLYDYDEVIKVYYECGENMTKTQEVLNCTYGVVRNALLSRNIVPVRNKGRTKETIYELDDNNNIIKVFDDVFKVFQEYPEMTLKGFTDYLCNKKQKTYKDHYFCREVDYEEYKNEKHKDIRKSKVRCIEENKVFSSMSEAGRWILSQNPEYNGSIKSMSGNISRAIRRGIKAYGYTWENV